MEFSQIFAYEPRENTPAANLKPLPQHIIEDRICEAIATYIKM
jgi:tRNA A37 methylthiotransferase MiaB